MRIAIVGTGISGLSVAHALHREHDLTLFEAGDHVGGHTHTHDIEVAGGRYAVDTGFIVYNERTYPHFCKLLAQLGVSTQSSEMSFSVRDERSGLEYCGRSLNALFAQRRNLLRPTFHGMVRDILRFNREAPALLEGRGDDVALGDYLTGGGYGDAFIEHYILPMGGAVWSSSREQMLAFPARFFVRFFQNHGMLSVNDQPQWRVVQGGSRQYVTRLIAGFADCIRLNTPVRSITRHDDGVEIQPAAGPAEIFDQVVLACHADQAAALLADPSPAEREVLGCFPYQVNDTVLHTDERLMPRRRRAWASWNYHVLPTDRAVVTVTYNMNILQSLDCPQSLCVTLNRTSDVNPERILKRMTYHHPVFTPAGVAAQRRWDEISGQRRTWYCGAYWRYGFHEDGVVSGLRVAEGIRSGTEADAAERERRAFSRVRN